MMMLSHLGDAGTPASAPGNTNTTTTQPTMMGNFVGYAQQAWTGAQKWLHPSEAIAVVTDTVQGKGPGLAVAAGVALPVLLILGMMGGRKRGLF